MHGGQICQRAINCDCLKFLKPGSPMPLNTSGRQVLFLFPSCGILGSMCLASVGKRMKAGPNVLILDPVEFYVPS